MGGLGEVSTQNEHRGKGLAIQLSQMATRYMEEKRIPISSLHTSPPTMALYRRAGYTDADIPYLTLPQITQDKQDLEFQKFSEKYPSETAMFDPKKFIIKRGTFLSVDESVRPKLMEIQQNFAKKFNGAVVRTEEYWNKWINNEGILEQEQKYSWVIYNQKSCVGYVSVQLHKDDGSLPNIIFRDWTTIYDLDEHLKIRTIEMVSVLVISNLSQSTANLSIPFIFGGLCPFQNTCTSAKVLNKGMMYKKIQFANKDQREEQESLIVDSFLEKVNAHLFWLGDYY